MKRGEVQNMVLSALFVAIGVVLARLVHLFVGFQGGAMLLPMHLPILLCGFICGPKYGMLSGFLTPLVSTLISGMPAGDTLIAMEFELAAYGLFAGLFSSPSFTPISRIFPKKSREYVHILLALVFSMVIGRGVWGIVKAIISTRGDNPFGWAVFLSGAFTSAVVGIIIQVAIIPPLVLLFKHSKIGRGKQ